MAALAPIAIGVGGMAASGAFPALTAMTAGAGLTGGLSGGIMWNSARVGLMSTLGNVAGLAGTALSALGSMQEGQAAQQSAAYNAAVARQNAQVAEYQTKQNLEKQDRERRLRMGAMRAAQGGSGVRTSGDLFASSAAQEELDLMTIASEGALKKQGYQSTAMLESMKGKSAKRAGYIGAGASLLSGAARMLK